LVPGCGHSHSVAELAAVVGRYRLEGVGLGKHRRRSAKQDRGGERQEGAGQAGSRDDTGTGVVFAHKGLPGDKKMYGLTNFLSVLWYTAAGWFGIGRDQAHAVTLFDGNDPLDAEAAESKLAFKDDGRYGGYSYDYDYGYTKPQE
jgi:hypothetical protein